MDNPQAGEVEQLAGKSDWYERQNRAGITDEFDQELNPELEAIFKARLVTPPTPAPAGEVEQRSGWNFPDDLLEFAWIIIANANGGDWESASPEWRKAAEQWRDGYHKTLTPAPAGEVEQRCPVNFGQAHKFTDGECEYCGDHLVTPAPAGDVEERLLHILGICNPDGHKPCWWKDSRPGDRDHLEHEQYGAIIALFTASQPPVVEGGELDEPESILSEFIVDTVDAPSNTPVLFRVREGGNIGLAHMGDIDELKRAIAARQQSADEVRREVAESLGIGGEMSHELACPAMIEFKSQNEWTDPISVFEYMCTCGAAAVNQERARMRFVLKEQKHE